MATIPRSSIARRLCSATGSFVKLISAGDGWPSTIECQTSRGSQRVALYVSPVSRLYPNSRPDDYRVQNPGSDRSIVDDPSAITIAIGWWTGHTPIVVACDPSPWKSTARVSQMFKLSMLEFAEKRGWDSYRNNNDDVFHAFRPELFSAYVEAVVRKVDLTDLALIRKEIQQVATEYLEGQANNAAASERARVACLRLVRSTAFTRDVVKAYSGRCAICGLNFGLGQAAHIVPVASTGSTDEVVNGLCLCPNHHLAFDKHLIWIDPVSGVIRLHPSLRTGVLTDGDKGLVDTALAIISPPVSHVAKPQPELFQRRYNEFQLHYAWVQG